MLQPAGDSVPGGSGLPTREMVGGARSAYGVLAEVSAAGVKRSPVLD